MLWVKLNPKRSKYCWAKGFKLFNFADFCDKNTCCGWGSIEERAPAHHPCTISHLRSVKFPFGKKTPSNDVFGSNSYYLQMIYVPICFSSSSLWRKEHSIFTGSGDDIFIWRGPVSPRWVKQLWSRKILTKLSELPLLTRYACLTDGTQVCQKVKTSKRF